MRANELRISNYTKQGRIISFYESGVHVGFGKCFSFEELEPIPLTEEILLKCGFKWTDKEFEEYLEFKIFRTVKLFADYSDNFSIITFRINDTVIELKYLHQLQNLYHALTGEELTVNL